MDKNYRMLQQDLKTMKLKQALKNISQCQNNCKSS